MPRITKESRSILILAAVAAGFPAYIISLELFGNGKVEHWGVLITWGALAACLAISAVREEYRSRTSRRDEKGDLE